jgi:hypothetical protein
VGFVTLTWCEEPTITNGSTSIYINSIPNINTATTVTIWQFEESILMFSSLPGPSFRETLWVRYYLLDCQDMRNNSYKKG